MTVAAEQQTPFPLLARLQALDTCVLSDALDRLDMPGAVLGIVALSTARRIAGRAVTVRLGVADGTPARRHLSTAAVEAGGPGTVIVVEHPGGPAAGWGGLLSLAARERGIEGVIVDGPARDIDEASALGFPVFARSATPVTARGRLVEIGWNVPVTIGGATVAPDDLVLADASGVVFVPAARGRDVIGVAAGLAEREAAMARAIRKGTPVSQVMGGDYERLLARAADERP
jgi:regulator of RNase E activity RraA